MNTNLEKETALIALEGFFGESQLRIYYLISVLCAIHFSYLYPT